MDSRQEPWELVSFERVGPVRLGASREEVAAALGRPDREEGPAQFFGDQGPVRVIYDPEGKVLAVEVGPERPVVFRGCRLTRADLDDARRELGDLGIATEPDPVAGAVVASEAGIGLHTFERGRANPPGIIQSVSGFRPDYFTVRDAGPSVETGEA
jgi:hypothetical protein